MLSVQNGAVNSAWVPAFAGTAVFGAVALAGFPHLMVI